jgi:hypothetical protein
MCDFNGNDLGKSYTKVSGVMDRFFVPRHIFDATEFKNKKVHPGMKKQQKKLNEQALNNLLEVE